MRVSIDEVVIEVTAKPGASRRGVIGVTGERLVVAIHSPPDKGKANDELIEYLAREMRVPRSALLIVRGETSRSKTIRVVTHEPTKVASRLRKIANSK
ncbi:MAG: DUF167 domain-containing protein [Candidatus Binatus sp.]